MNQNVLKAIEDLNHPSPLVKQAMTIVDQGIWIFHWFPVRFDFEYDELAEASAVLEFEIHGVYGIIWFQEVYDGEF